MSRGHTRSYGHVQGFYYTTLNPPRGGTLRPTPEIWTWPLARAKNPPLHPTTAATPSPLPVNHAHGTYEPAGQPGGTRPVVNPTITWGAREEASRLLTRTARSYLPRGTNTTSRQIRTAAHRPAKTGEKGLAQGPTPTRLGRSPWHSQPGGTGLARWGPARRRATSTLRGDDSDQHGTRRHLGYAKNQHGWSSTPPHTTRANVRTRTPNASAFPSCSARQGTRPP